MKIEEILQLIYIENPDLKSCHLTFIKDHIIKLCDEMQTKYGINLLK